MSAAGEASVQDRFAALARTVTRKLRLDPRATRGDEVGGSTYHVEIWRGHPFEDTVLGELRRFRDRMTELRRSIVTTTRSVDPRTGCSWTRPTGNPWSSRTQPRARAKRAGRRL
jgi:hypothetical protein